MDSSRKDNQEELLNEIDSILVDVNQTVEADEKFIDDLEETPSSINSFGTKKDLLHSFTPTDGRIELKISDDKMKVFATFYPPKEGGNLISLNMLDMVINKGNIKGKYNPESLIDKILECNLDKKIQANVLIIEGVESTPSYSESFVIAKDILIPEDLVTNNSENIDYKQLSQFILVHQGDFIGEIKPPVIGQEGMDVFGKIMPSKKNKLHSPNIGKNLEVSEEFVYSMIEGKLNISEKKIFAEEVLIISENVDYHTGNISYAKDVIVKGEVADGFKIKVGGNLLFEKVLDASNVYCKGNLTVNRGIIGRKKNIVQTEGNLKTSFIEHCTVYAGGEILIKKSILNSEIYCSKNVNMENNSKIIGGVLYSTNGVITNQLGSESGVLTQIFCGVDYVVQKKLELIRDQNIKLLTQYKKINFEINRPQVQNQNKLIEKRDLMFNTMNQLQ